MLSKMGYAGVNPKDVKAIPYWENMFPALKGTDIGFGTNTTATQVVYNIFANNLANETYALFELDTPDAVSGAGFNVPGHSYQPYRYYHDQFSSLYSWRTIGQSDYNALQVSFRKRFSHGLQGDFNYAWSKSMDWTSAAERVGTPLSTRSPPRRPQTGNATRSRRAARAPWESRARVSANFARRFTDCLAGIGQEWSSQRLVGFD
jgi:hypothetical protein